MAWRFAATLASTFAPTLGFAQEPAARWEPNGGVIEYQANESGGKIRLVAKQADSAAIETIRLELLEAAAAIRRGDLRVVRVLHPSAPLPALARRRRLVRCTFRPLPRGGELVLLSDDGDTVAAIHQILAHRPPGSGPP